MQLHHLKPKTRFKKKKRIGRGGKRGTYSGRGIKGQKARAGHKMRPEIRDVIKKIPKLRGYRAKFRPKLSREINLEALEKHFKDGDKITPRELVRRGLVQPRSGKLPEIKILGSGEITKKLLVSDFQVSEGAKKKIEKAGGAIGRPKI
ncbi:MAG: 50S ribosomal protein L15 [Candidatus Niyogibacteria bacterium]|nr:50S ribosomal protein L15 [Candidatus Niyogibacteria bacterium]